MNIWAEQFDAMKSTNTNKLEKKINNTWSTLDVTYDKEYNTVYVHNSDILNSKEFLKLQFDFEFNVAQGIFVEKKLYDKEK